ncbi:DUF6588 family protein [Siansivirga zeaxanthinifaciens]|uniref:Outer membrane protein beta-barrel domain-containing protein n=1 Tax=Siansivirga zeaxanthinifaciens CC-SAMT-1 TaxID=1454006 RepID=A0A0C5WEP9_9FLAO|nr:DUF6588 family protein [Siansivirga zeaxanthinifaciens]AJR03679.1 hypothetical protein AW14_08615 [Siansivirga zeaxanthinifaciens CC-SAMT-1]
MRKITCILLFFMAGHFVKAQNDIDALLAAGIKDAQRFATDYLKPGSDGLIYSMNANWFNSGKVKPLGGFEISVIANASLINDDDKMFLMNTADYDNVKFKNITNPSSKMVATVLGENNPDVIVEVTYDDPIFGSYTEDVILPNGITENLNMLPTAFIQGAIGISKGTEIKARFVPKINTDDVELGMYGVGLQHEFTNWLPADKIWPIAVSGLVAYTHLDANYDLTDSSGIDGDNQHLENKTNTWLFQLIASTKLPVINFYGGIGYISGKSESDLLGTYRISNGLQTKTIEDPFSVSSKASGMRGSLGARLKLGFFRLNAEYHLAEFDAFSVGINFGFR